MKVVYKCILEFYENVSSQSYLKNRVYEPLCKVIGFHKRIQFSDSANRKSSQKNKIRSNSLISSCVQIDILLCDTRKGLNNLLRRKAFLLAPPVSNRSS
jgi:hypothetical protein